MIKKPNRTSLRLDLTGISNLPGDLFRCQQLRLISAKGNRISSLPDDFNLLSSLEHVNLGSNLFSTFPHALTTLVRLRVLHLFNNEITELPTCIGLLTSLTFLNLNDNLLERLPDSICELYNLTHLSLQRNKLTSLPRTIGRLQRLQELNVSDNQLNSLANELGELKSLKKLVAYRNYLQHIPYTLGNCSSLTVLDVSVNMIRYIPTQLGKCNRLKELHIEQNLLLQEALFSSVPGRGILPLKEIALRLLLSPSNTHTSTLSASALSQLCTSLRDAVLYAEECSVCSEYFYFNYIECVHFVSSKQLSEQSSVPRVPLRIGLCSVNCFERAGQGILGVVNCIHRKWPTKCWSSQYLK